MSEIIPVNTPDLSGREEEYLIAAIRSGWISSDGPFVRQFEEKFAARVGRSHGIAVANGSVALDAAVAALGIGPGDEVILPTFTIISCAAAVVRIGAIPVTVDSDPRTWNMDVSQIEAKITSRTRAIMVVHIYGLPVDMDPLLALARKHGLAVIEDAAEMHGQTYRTNLGANPDSSSLRSCGSFGDLSTFSFYANKHITTGEGGMIVTDDDALALRCRSLRNLCFQPHRRFVHEELGWNFRLTNLQAALGLAQLESLERTVDRKRAIGKLYTERLAGIEGLQLPVPETPYAQNIYWVFGIVLDDSLPFDAEEMMGRLASRNIGTRPFFWPMHEQPVFRKMGLFPDVHSPVAERLARRGFYLPSGAGLSDAQVDTVSSAVQEIMR